MSDDNRDEYEGRGEIRLTLHQTRHAEAGKADGDNEHQAAQKRPWYREPNVIIEGSMAIFTLLMLFSSVAQWAITRETLRSTQRPWVLPGEIPMRARMDEPTKPARPEGFVDARGVQFVGWIKNFGQSPALKAESGVRLKCLERPVRRGDASPTQRPVHCPNPSDIDFHSERGVFFLAPEQQVWIDRPYMWEECSLEEILRGTHELLAYGRIDYSDQFGMRHRTKFCFRYEIMSRTWDPATDQNEAD